MSAKPILYSTYFSWPTRSVWLVAKEIGLKLDIQTLNLFAGDHKTPEFLKKNPQHTVPTLDDNGYCIWDSHAICTYLITKYAKNDKLYPVDPQIRGRIDQRLHFDTGILYPRISACSFPVFVYGSYEFSNEKIAAIHEAYDWIEKFLENDLYIVGNSLTVADFSFITTITQLNHIYAPIDPVKYPKIIAWIKRMEQLPYFNELNTVHLDKFKIFNDGLLAKNRAAAGK